MTILLLILVVVCLWGLRFPGYDSSYLSPDRANAIKGIFTFLILFSHLSGYVVLSDSWADVPYVRVQEHLGQLIVAIFLLAYFVAHHLWGIDIYGGVACLFCLVVMLFSSWIKVGNPVLAWAGKNAFTIYIIQRLPMIVFSFYGLNMHPAFFMMAVIPVTFLLAEGLSRLYKRIDKRIYA